MDAAPQLVHCGIEPVRFSVNSNRFIRNRVPVRRRNGPVLAVATEPKLPETGPAKPSRPGTVNGSSSSPPLKSVNGVSSRMGEVSQEIKRMRAQMEEDEQLAILMKGLRGQNLSDSQFAEDDVQLRLVELLKEREDEEDERFLVKIWKSSAPRKAQVVGWPYWEN